MNVMINKNYIIPNNQLKTPQFLHNFVSQNCVVKVSQGAIVCYNIIKRNVSMLNVYNGFNKRYFIIIYF